jgi:hypothetical protein
MINRYAIFTVIQFFNLLQLSSDGEETDGGMLISINLLIFILGNYLIFGPSD